MEIEKNLRVHIPAEMLAQLQQLAEEEQTSIDELVRDAIEMDLWERDTAKVCGFRSQEHHELGIKPE